MFGVYVPFHTNTPDSYSKRERDPPRNSGLLSQQYMVLHNIRTMWRNKKKLKRDINLTLFLSFPQQRPWQAAPEDTMAKMPWIKPIPVIIVDNVMICNLSNISCMPRNKGTITHGTFYQKWNNLPSLLKMDSVCRYCFGNNGRW